MLIDVIKLTDPVTREHTINGIRHQFPEYRFLVEGAFIVVEILETNSADPNLLHRCAQSFAEGFLCGKRIFTKINT